MTPPQTLSGGVFPTLAVKALSLLKEEYANNKDFTGSEWANNLGKKLDRLNDRLTDLMDMDDAWQRCIKPGFKGDAAAWRQKGNKLYKSRKFTRALECYQRAIQASQSSRELSLNLGNKSATQIELGQLEKASQSALLALECEDVPTENRLKLEKRRQARRGTISNETLSANSTQTIRISYEEDQGRHGIADRDIEFGELLFIDEPIAVSVSKADCCWHCAKSLEESTHISSPMDGQTTFCSENCLVLAFNTYHVYECRLDLEMMFGKNKSSKLAARRFILATRLLVQFANFCKNPILERDYKYACDAALEDILPLKAMTQMVTNFDKMDDNKILGMAIVSVLQYRLMKTLGYLRMLKTWTFDDILAGPYGELLFHIQGAIKMNSHTINYHLAQYDQSKLCDAGIALYPVLPLLNHSCSPNTFRINVGGRVAVFASEDIPAGAEVTDCYGPNYVAMDRERRRKDLFSNYHFFCDCRACSANVVLTSETNKVSDHVKSLLQSIQEDITKELPQNAKAKCAEVHSALKSANVSESRTAVEALKAALFDVMQRLHGNSSTPPPTSTTATM